VNEEADYEPMKTPSNEPQDRELRAEVGEHADDADALEALGARLSAVLQDADPVPVSALAAARAALAWRTVDAELAELLAAPEPELAGVRSSSPVELPLRFAAADLRIEIEVQPAGRAVRLIGQLDPARTARVELQQARGDVRSATADDLGRFVITGAVPGPSRLVCWADTPGSTTVIRTDWFVL